MRWPLVIIALFVGLVLWDHFENDGVYTADVERGFREASLDMTGGGWKPPTFTVRPLPLDH